MILIQFTGLSGSGKTTLAENVRQLLIEKKYKVEIIDGDVYRKTICKDLGFSKEDRCENVRRLFNVGRNFVVSDTIVLMSVINPYENLRNELRNHEFVRTVYLDCSIDNLIERDPKGLHLHGELLKVRSTQNRNLILDWTEDLYTGDLDQNGHQLRPHIVWFGEDVPALEEAIDITETADYFTVIGTSLQVYPAAGLISYTPSVIPVFYIDPNPISIPNLRNKVEVIAEVASKGVAALRDRLKSGL
jgi:energy-coupling factor transporter ATP-binding protein EcfA2